jgi:dipeptide transport system ATP-binding protein
MAALNPAIRIGAQIEEVLEIHAPAMPKAERTARALALMREMQLPDPETLARRYPHEISGGQCQRVVIAMALAWNPSLLIADEPTTALDVTIQKQILDLLINLQASHGMGLVLITHDMGVVAETAHRVQVMYAGQMVEEQATDALFATPRHPYTAALLDALPERAHGRSRLPTIPGVVPGIDDRPSGCLFNPRCAHVTDLCRTTKPPVTDGTRCHTPLLAAEHAA